MSAYYTNGLKARRYELLKDLRQAMARYATLERTHHPSKIDQGKYIDLIKKMIAMVDAELERENPRNIQEEVNDVCQAGNVPAYDDKI